MSEVQVACDMNKLKNINVELKRLGNQMRILKNEKKELEENIIEYLKKVDQEGVRYKNTLAVSKEKKHRVKKGKNERENDILNILESAGISNTEKVLSEIKGALQGKEKYVNTLKIKELENSLYLE